MTDSTSLVPEIVRLPSFDVVGWHYLGSGETAFQDVPAFCQALRASGKMDWLTAAARPDSPIPGVLGVAIGDEHDFDKLDYWFAVPFDGPTPTDAHRLTIPAGDYAMLSRQTEEAIQIQELIVRLYDWRRDNADLQAPVPLHLEVYLPDSIRVMLRVPTKR
jgi:predicted transcriptional regulator YdeE